MAASGTRGVRLRVGVIGLGRLWEARHKPALLRLADQFQVTAVYDQVARRAAIEAGQIGCAAVEGITALVDRPDVDVVYLLSPQWFGLHPIGLACARGKAVYSAIPLVDCDGPEGLDRIADAIRAAGVAFMPEMARRFYPATLRLRELLATTLGRPRLVLGFGRLFGFDRYGQPGPTTQLSPAPLVVDPGSYLLDWCRFVFQAEPVAVQGTGRCVLRPQANGADAARAPETDFESFSVEFADGALAQVAFGRYHRGPWGDATRFLPQPGFQVFAENGAAWLEMPDHIQWSDADGLHDEHLPLEPTVGEILNDQFHRLVRGDQSLAPTLYDALTVARLVEALRQSQREGRLVRLANGPPPA